MLCCSQYTPRIIPFLSFRILWILSYCFFIGLLFIFRCYMFFFSVKRSLSAFAWGTGCHLWWIIIIVNIQYYSHLYVTLYIHGPSITYRPLLWISSDDSVVLLHFYVSWKLKTIVLLNKQLKGEKDILYQVKRIFSLTICDDRLILIAHLLPTCWAK